jgi:hypothetical protein
MVTLSREKQGGAAQPVRDVTLDAVRCITWPRFWLLMGEGCNVVVGSSRGTENGEPISIVCCCAAGEGEPSGGKAPLVSGTLLKSCSLIGPLLQYCSLIGWSCVETD